MQIVVNSLIVNYQRLGKGPLLVCVHGWGDSYMSFLPLASLLSKKYELLMLSLPGFDGQRLPRAWALEDYASFVHDSLSKLGIKKVHGYIGHSNGGAIVITGLTNGTLGASKVILLASSGIRGDNSSKKTVYKAVAKVGKVVSSPLPGSVKRRLRQKFYANIGSDYLLVPHLADTFKKITSQDIRQVSARLRMPALLIYGSADTATPPEFGRLLSSNMTDAKLIIVDGAGHFLLKEMPDQVAHYITLFLKEKNSA